MFQYMYKGNILHQTKDTSLISATEINLLSQTLINTLNVCITGLQSVPLLTATHTELLNSYDKRKLYVNYHTEAIRYRCTCFTSTGRWKM